MEQIRRQQVLFFVIDLLMLVILTVNLLWIVFDSLFGVPLIQSGLSHVSSGFVAFYTPIHRNFFFFDLAFIVVYLTEFMIRWGLALKRDTYHRWFFYPFIHWYDLVGCIPVNAFRFVRIFRVISIFYRLQKLEWVDFRGTFFYRTAAKYYDILVEEISDRVVINVLQGVQTEIRRGSPAMEKIVNQVVKSRKPEMVKWFSGKMQQVALENYGDIRDDIREYVNLRVRQAVNRNRELSGVKSLVPVVGGIVTRNIQNIVSDIVFQVLNGMAEDLSEKRLDDLFDRVADIVLGALLVRGEDQRLNQAVVEAVVDAIEIVKEQVRVQQWKLREDVFQKTRGSENI